MWWNWNLNMGKEHKGKSDTEPNNLIKKGLTKTLKTRNVNSCSALTNRGNGLLEVGKAGEYVWATFENLRHTQQPPEVQETRGHNNRIDDNENQAKLRNVNKGNAATNGLNTKRKVGEAGEDVRATFEHHRYTGNTQEHGELSVGVEKGK
jgi:hypothetical protein